MFRAVFERDLPGLIEELPRDFYCVSCDLVSGELVVHRDGPVVVAAGASQCLPGLAAPVALDGRLLVDGGVLNNLPVDVMAATGEGPVIAVDVTTRYRPPTSDGRRRRAGSSANGIWDDHTPRPSVLETIGRSLVLGSVAPSRPPASTRTSSSSRLSPTSACSNGTSSTVSANESAGAHGKRWPQPTRR